MYLPILIPSVCVGSVLALAFIAYSCWKTLRCCPPLRCPRERSAMYITTPVHGNPHQHHIMTLGWRDLQVALKGGAKHVILHASYGTTSRRQLAAIIGPSGAGKSTLLDALAMRSCGMRTGSVLINGKPVTDSTVAAIASYIPQDDHLLPSMTCFETLMIAAVLKVRASSVSHEGLVEHSLNAVGLAKVADSQVGGLLPGGLRVRGISGGEKRRLSIACGVIGAPEIVFLDEPTSGLDTSSALTVVQCIRSLANDDRIVLTSIHQPRARIWEMFDSVVVMAEGHTLYCGPTTEAVAWFMGCHCDSNDLRLQYIPEVHGMVCEWLTDIIAAPAGEKAERSQGNRSDLLPCDLQHQSETLSGKDILKMAEKHRKGYTAIPMQPTEEKNLIMRLRRQSLWTQYRKLQFRATCSYSRNPANAAGRTVMAVGLGILLGVVFFQKPSGLEGVRQDEAALFYVAMLLTLMPYTYMSMFVADRVFFIEDPLQPLYSTLAYYASVSGINALVSMLNGVLVVLIVYGFLGLLSTARAVLITLIVTALHSLCSVQLLVMMANLCPNQDLAFVVAVSYTTLCILLAGCFVRLVNVASFFRGLSYLTYFRYTIMALTRLQHSDRPDGDCMAQSGGLTCEAILTRSDVDLSLQTCIIGLVVVLIVLHIASFGGLARSRIW